MSDVSAADTNQSTVLNSSSHPITTNTSVSTSNSKGTLSNESKATPVSPKVTFTTTQINTASSKIKTFVETNNRLPNFVTISNKQVTMPQFLLLLTEDLSQINNGLTSPIVLKNVKSPLNPSENVQGGSLPKSEYLTIAQQIKNSIDATGTAPDSENSTLGKIQYESLIYTYSKVMSYYVNYKKLPATVTVKAWNNTTNNLSSTIATSEGNQTVDQILRKAAKFGYSSAAHDAAGLIKYGSGDCWAMSDYLYKQFSASGIKSRIVQYGTQYSSNHRSVQLYQSGSWVDVPYRQYGFNSMFNNTSGSKNGSVIAG